MNTSFTDRCVTHITFVAIPTALSCAVLSCAILSHNALAQTPSPNGAAELELNGQPLSISEPPTSPTPLVPEEIEIDVHQGTSAREEQDLQREQEQSVPENIDQPDLPAGNETPEQDSPDQLEIP